MGEHTDHEGLGCHACHVRKLRTASHCARKAIQRSSELIRRTSALLEKTRVFISRLGAIDSKDDQWIQRDSRCVSGTLDLMLSWIMESALQITNASMANIQLVDPDSGCLHIAAHYGFSRPFLDYFDCVHEGQAAGGEALKTRTRVIVEDVTKSPIFRGSPALEVLLDAGVR